MTLTDNNYRDLGQELMDNAPFGGYLSLKEARELRLKALHLVKFQNQELKPFKSMPPEPETVIYSQTLKDEESGEVKQFDFKARLGYTVKQYFVILLNERLYHTKQELKNLISRYV